MNKRTLFFIGLMLFIGYFTTQAQYKYLRYTDLEKWKTLSHAEKIEISQIPNEQLDVIPTNELLDLCLSYPLLSDIFAYDDDYHAFIQITKNINVFNVFYKRQDATNSIINAYKDNKPAEIVKNQTKNNVPYVFLFIYLDMISAQKETIDKMNSEQRFELLSLLAENVEQRSKYNSYYSSSWFVHSALAMGYIFKKENMVITKDAAISKRIDDFLHGAHCENTEDINLILQEAMKYKK